MDISTLDKTNIATIQEDRREWKIPLDYFQSRRNTDSCFEIVMRFDQII